MRGVLSHGHHQLVAETIVTTKQNTYFSSSHFALVDYKKYLKIVVLVESSLGPWC